MFFICVLIYYDIIIYIMCIYIYICIHTYAYMSHSLPDEGFYFVCVMKVCSELCLTKRYDFVCNLFFAPRAKSYTRNCAV